MNFKFNNFPCVIMTLVSWTIGTKQTNNLPSYIEFFIKKMRYTHIWLIKLIIGIAQVWFQIPMNVGWILVF